MAPKSTELSRYSHGFVATPLQMFRQIHLCAELIRYTVGDMNAPRAARARRQELSRY